MKYIGLSIIYVAFFALIGFVCYHTNSAVPLWALLLTPEYTEPEEKNKKGNP